jgi:hypothetical protein
MPILEATMGLKATVRRQKERARIEKRIREAMKDILGKSGWTKHRLAKEMKEHPTTVGRWLEGSTTIPAWFIVKFCDVTGVGPGSVLHAVGDVRGVDVGRRAGLRDTAKLLRGISDHLKKGHVPEVSP